MPESGGEYTYLLHGVHAVVSYLYCYMTAIVMKPAPVAILGKVRERRRNLRLTLCILRTHMRNCDHAFITNLTFLSRAKEY